MFYSSAFIGLFTLIACASAELYITLPDAHSTWYSGSVGTIQWNTSATEFGLLCDIQLIDALTQEIALNITNKSIPCSVDICNTTALPEFDNENFLIRIGINSNISIWSYTQDFKILPAQK